MAHMAKIENETVVQVIVVCACDFGGCDSHLRPEADHSRCGAATYPAIERKAQRWLKSIGMTGEWLLTSYNHNFRGQYAGVGMRYDSARDEFVR